jgi:hypothetical protein
VYVGRAECRGKDGAVSKWVVHLKGLGLLPEGAARRPSAEWPNPQPVTPTAEVQAAAGGAALVEHPGRVAAAAAESVASGANRVAERGVAPVGPVPLAGDCALSTVPAGRRGLSARSPAGLSPDMARAVELVVRVFDGEVVDG